MGSRPPVPPPRSDTAQRRATKQRSSSPANDANNGVNVRAGSRGLSVKVKKEAPDDEIKEYAATAMSELLGWYGYEKVDSGCTRGLNLDHFAPPATSRHHHLPQVLSRSLAARGPSSRSPPPAALSSRSPQSRSSRDTCSRPTTSSPLSLRTGPASPRAPESSDTAPDTPDGPTTCSWCGRAGGTWEPGGGSISGGATGNNGSGQFCSEACFAAGRRAAFKRARTCDWCRHVRHSVSYVDFQDGESQLQFCSDKCLNQYKMNIFCRETQAHLELHGLAAANGDITGGGAGGSAGLITPDLWLRDCRSPPPSPAEGEEEVEEEEEEKEEVVVEEEEDAEKDEDEETLIVDDEPFACRSSSSAVQGDDDDEDADDDDDGDDERSKVGEDSRNRLGRSERGGAGGRSSARLTRARNCAYSKTRVRTSQLARTKERCERNASENSDQLDASKEGRIRPSGACDNKSPRMDATDVALMTSPRPALCRDRTGKTDYSVADILGHDSVGSSHEIAASTSEANNCDGVSHERGGIHIKDVKDLLMREPARTRKSARHGRPRRVPRMSPPWAPEPPPPPLPPRLPPSPGTFMPQLRHPPFAFTAHPGLFAGRPAPPAAPPTLVPPPPMMMRPPLHHRPLTHPPPPINPQPQASLLPPVTVLVPYPIPIPIPVPIPIPIPLFGKFPRSTAENGEVTPKTEESSAVPEDLSQRSAASTSCGPPLRIPAVAEAAETNSAACTTAPTNATKATESKEEEAPRNARPLRKRRRLPENSEDGEIELKRGSKFVPV